MVGPCLRRLALPALLLLLLVVLAPAQAEQYEGPGHRGMVPVGDGGLLAESAPGLGEGFTQVPLEGLPEKTCRVVLDENETYARALLVWTPGNTTAFVAAHEGERDAPFRVLSHWENDMNDNCTVEVTPEGRTWHDPRGRPFIDLAWEKRVTQYEVVTGTWFRVEVILENNGTIEETVDVGITHLREDWEVRNSTGFVGRVIAPEATLRFGFDVQIPQTEKTGRKLLEFEATAEQSGWRGLTSALIHVEGSDGSLARSSEQEEGMDPHHAQDPPSQKVGPSGQVPMVPVLPVALFVLALLALVRARR